MTKFKQAVDEMILAHRAEFEEFKKIHELYRVDQQEYQDEFDRVGRQWLQIVAAAENRLCGKMENGGKGKYSARLAEKFRAEVKRHFPLIDFVGVKID